MNNNKQPESYVKARKEAAKWLMDSHMPEDLNISFADSERLLTRFILESNQKKVLHVLLFEKYRMKLWIETVQSTITSKLSSRIEFPIESANMMLAEFDHIFSVKNDIENK